jgi:hypothetical protein
VLVGRHPERVGRLVLTSCDAFENFPPKAVAYLPWLARVPASFRLVGHVQRLSPLQRVPITYDWATHRPIDPRIPGGVGRAFAQVSVEA